MKMTEAQEAGYIKMIAMLDSKLKEMMTHEEYVAFSTEVAKEAFKAEIDAQPEGEFKEFVKDNFEKITEEVPNV